MEENFHPNSSSYHSNILSSCANNTVRTPDTRNTKRILMNPYSFFEPFEFGSHSAELTYRLSAEANVRETPQKDVDHDVRAARLLHAKANYWSRPVQARKMAVGKRHIQSFEKHIGDYTNKPKSAGISLLAMLVAEVPEGVEITETEARDILKKKYQEIYPAETHYFPLASEEDVRRLLREGIDKNDPERSLFKEKIIGKGRLKERKYIRTGVSFKYAPPKTFKERSEVAFRANRILLKMEPSNVSSLTVRLGVNGVAYLLEKVINSEERFRPFWDFMNKYEQPAKRRAAHSKTPPPPFTLGTVATLGLLADELRSDADLLAPISWSITHFVTGMAAVWPLRMFLGNKEIRAFEASWGSFCDAFQAEVLTAQKISKPDKKLADFVLSIGWAKL